MTQVANHHSLATILSPFNDKTIENVTLENMLTDVIKMLKAEMKETTANIDNPKGLKALDEPVKDMIQMISSVKLLVSHFEFIVAVLKSKSKKEVKKIKERFSNLRSRYEKIQTKEDIAQVPAKYVVVTMFDKLVLELKRVLKSCFKKNKDGSVQHVKSTDNMARIKIITRRFEIGDIHFPMVAAINKDDIFCHEKSSSTWQELYKVAEFKKVVNKQEVASSFKMLHLAVQISFIVIKKSKKGDEQNLKHMLSLVQDILYYGVQHAQAETQALFHLINPNVDDAFTVWNLTEHPVISRFLGFRLPFIGNDERIYIPRLFPAITQELVLKEFEDKTINKIHPMDSALLRGPDLSANKEEVLNQLFIDSEEKIPIRILAKEALNLRGQPGFVRGLTQKASNVLMGSDPNTEEAIVINIHGGGWIALSSSTYRVFLTRWAKNLKMIHFAIDYRLAPKNPYPAALDDVWQGYLWIMNYAETVLGIKTPKVILTGDSAGGTLAMALTLRIIRAGLPAPHGCLLLYPSLNNDPNAHSPSFFLTLDHHLLPYSLLKLCVSAYVGDNPHPTEDPFISPLAASDELLAKLPPIRIISGNEDPLQDDNWRFVAKLRKLNKDVKLIVYENLSHAFLSHQDLKHYDRFVNESCDIIRRIGSHKALEPFLKFCVPDVVGFANEPGALG